MNKKFVPLKGLVRTGREAESSKLPSPKGKGVSLAVKPRAKNKASVLSIEVKKTKIQEENADQELPVRLIAFFLPQFHPISENDQWWGTGFTEWSQVTTARPLFPGHYQPHLPSDLGFYDLRLAETRCAQAKLAKEHGIYGFCYYYYWFSGRKVLEAPLEGILASGEPEFPFCVCWANEPWSRRWDGSEQEVLLSQEHDVETDKQLIHELLPLFKDSRYITVNGAPLLVIYRAGLLPDPVTLFDYWRSVAKSAGFVDLHISMAETFGAADPYEFGFDSAVEFPPHGVVADPINATVQDLPSDYDGKIYDYNDIVKREINRPKEPYVRYRTVMPSWDNTARRGKSGNAFLRSSPSSYEVWLSDAIAKAYLESDPDHRIVFINAWNEWGEGAHLEPDRRYGRAYLTATRRALTDRSDWQTILKRLNQYEYLSSPEIGLLSKALERRMQRLEMTNRYLVEQLIPLDAHGQSMQFTEMDLTVGKVLSTDDRGYIEQVNRFTNGRVHILKRSQGLFIVGWSLSGPLPIDDDMSTYLTLLSTDNGLQYSTGASNIEPRLDVVEHYQNRNEELSVGSTLCGFKFKVNLDNIEAGNYKLVVDRINNDQVSRFVSNRRLIIG